MNIDEFRAQYPEYSDLSDEDLTKNLHSKYYSDLDFDEFAEKFSGGKKKEYGWFNRLFGSEIKTHDGFPAVVNEDGSISTEITITVQDERLNNGKPTNIPSLWGGNIVDEETAVKNAIKSNKKYDSFDSIDEAVKSAQVVSDSKIPASWSDTLKAIPAQIVGGAEQAEGGMIQAAAAPPSRSNIPIPFPPAQLAAETAFQVRKLITPEGLPEAREFGEFLTERGTERIEEATPENQTFWQKAVSTAGVSAGTMVPAGAAAFLTKNPGLVAPAFGVQEFGRAYGNAKAEGLDDATAMRHATISGALEAGTEYLPAKALFKAGSGPFKRLVNFMIREIPGENIAEVGQLLSERINGLKDEITAEELVETIKLTTASTFLTGSAQSAAASILERKPKVTAEERREDPEKRERVETLKQRIDDLGVKVARGEATQDELMATVKELHSELTTDSLTGLKNERAFAESEKKPAQASIDLDGLKWINDNMGHPKGDEMFQQVGAAFREAFGDQVFRKNTGGDEFIAQGNDQAALKETLEAVQDRLSRSTLKVTLENGDVVTKQGIEFSFVVDETYEKADARLKSEKESRAEAGKRAGRGEQPPGVVIQPAEQAGETGVTDPAEVGKTIPADQLDELMADESTGSETQLETGSENVQRGTSPQELLAERETGKYAGNINLERLDTTQDIDRIFTALAPEKQTPISHAQVVAEAKALGLKSNEVLKWTRQNGITLEGVQAARQILVESGQDLIGKAKVAQGGDAKALIDFKASLERHNAIMARVSGMTAEAGRILNQFNITTEASKGALEAIEEISALGNTKQIAKRMATLDDPAQINKYSKKAYRATTSDVLLEAWINGLLSGPQTHVVNTVSNTFVSWLNNIEYLPAAAIAKLTKGDVTFREAFSRLSGFIPGAIEGTQLASRAFISEEPSDVSTKVEARRHKAISAESLGVTGPLGSVVDYTGQAVRIPSRLLMVEDEFFKAIGYRQALNGLSMRIAQQEGLTGTALDKRVEELKNEPTEAMMAYARANAQYQTFTNPLGETGKAVMRFANTHPAFRLIMPFIRTPTNIVKFAGQRSPLAPLMADVRSSLMGKGPVEREVALARIMTGSAIIGATAYYASLGLITGGGPEDEKEKAALYRTGWQPYSVRIGDAYYAYNRLEPTGMLLGITADAVGIWEKAKQEEQEEMAAVITAGAISSIGNNLLSKTWLRGISDAVQAINDPQRYGERWINNFAGTVIPTGVAQMARTQDPYLREVESIMDQIKSRVPGQRETLTPKLNLWGEPIKLTGGIGPDILSPVYTSFDKNDTVADEMIRLEVYPAMPQKKIRGIKLTPEQYNEYVEMAGAPAKQFLDQVMQTEEYGRMPDFMRRDLIEKVVKQTRNKAAVQMQIKYPEIPVGSVEEKVKEISQ